MNTPADGRLDILLIFPPVSLAEGFGPKNFGRYGGNLAPLGVASLAAYLREQGFRVAILDCPTSRLTAAQTVQAVLDLKPRAVGFSATTYVFPVAAELASRIRTAAPDTLLILGGGHANIQPVSPLEESSALDLLGFGDGEITLGEVMRAYQARGFDRRRLLEDEAALNGILGISRRGKDGAVRKNLPRPPLEDLDVLPIPARDLLPMHLYRPFPMYYRRLPVHNMVVSRGCPFACTFCDQGVLSGFRGRIRSPKKVIEEMKFLRDEYGAQEISFWDDTLTFHKGWTREFCGLLEKEKLGIGWNCYAAIRTVDQETLGLLKKAGCWKIFYGIETGNEDMMPHIKIERKNKSLDYIRQVVRWTHEAGIETHLSFMLGLPGETPEKGQKTIDFAVELDPDYAQFSMTTSFPGTEMYDVISKFGTLTTRDWKDYHGWEAVFLPSGYESTDQLKAMEKRAYKSFFLRPGYVLKKIAAIRSWTDVRRYYYGVRILADTFLLRDSKHGFNVRG